MKKVNLSRIAEKINYPLQPVINIKKLKMVAESIFLLSMGNHGITYYNPQLGKLVLFLERNSDFNDLNLRKWIFKCVENNSENFEISINRLSETDSLPKMVTSGWLKYDWDNNIFSPITD